MQGVCPIALPTGQHTSAQCCRDAEFGLDRMLVKAAAVLLAAACMHFPTGRRWLLAKTLKTDTCRRWLPLYSRTKVPRRMWCSQRRAGYRRWTWAQGAYWSRSWELDLCTDEQ